MEEIRFNKDKPEEALLRKKAQAKGEEFKPFFGKGRALTKYLFYLVLIALLIVFLLFVLPVLFQGPAQGIPYP